MDSVSAWEAFFESAPVGAEPKPATLRVPGQGRARPKRSMWTPTVASEWRAYCYDHQYGVCYSRALLPPMKVSTFWPDWRRHLGLHRKWGLR